jgi:hypothetical protein
LQVKNCKGGFGGIREGSYASRFRIVFRVSKV